MKRFFFSITLCVVSQTLFAQTVESRLRYVVDTSYQAHPKSVGIMVHVEAPDQQVSLSYATGYGDKSTKKKINADQPVWVASNTKTYVAAAILKLVELHTIYLGQPIDTLVSRKTRTKLKGNGYDLNKITIRHLLSHTSGIDDYVNDDYLEFVNTNRKHKWTRDEQITLGMKVGHRLSAAGDTFKYADLNYLLLTEVIEHCTGKPFYTAIDDLLRFKYHNVNETWFVDLQKTPGNMKPRAHQYWSKYPWDSYDFDPSFDLYGGGGIATTTKDLASFFWQLFESKIIKDPEVLGQMYSSVPCKTKTNYCLGIRVLTIAGYKGYYHGGFWGTDVIYFPELHAAVSIFILEKSERDLSAEICKAVVGVLGEGRGRR